MLVTKRIAPCLWFDTQAEEAANFYISVFKNFRIGGENGVSMQYRLEMYNAFNHTQFGGVGVSGVDTTAQFNPNTGAQTNARFGWYTAARDSRRIVMGLKLNF